MVQGLLMLLLGGGLASGQTTPLNGGAGEATETAVYVTIRVETVSDEWVRLILRDQQMGTIEILETGETFGLTPKTVPDTDEVRVQVLRLREEASGDRHPGAPSETLTAKVGFPSFPATSQLYRIDVESVESRRVPVGGGARPSPLRESGLSSEIEVTDQCCLTCGGVRSCGCFVGASCGSCCDCCSPPAI